MPRLTLAACRPLALRLLPRVCAEGLIAPFRSWKHPAAASYLRTMEAGREFPDALRAMSPRLPAVLEGLLILGATRGVLDYVAEDIRHTWPDVSPLLRKYRTLPAALCVSEACLSREVGKLFRRAAAERASSVVLKAGGEQVYLGVKPVRVIEEGLARIHAAMRSAPGGTRRILRRGRRTLRVAFA